MKMDAKIKSVMRRATDRFLTRDLGWFIQAATHGVFDPIVFVDLVSLTPGTRIVRLTSEHEWEMKILDPKMGLVKIMMHRWTEFKKGRITGCRVRLKTKKAVVPRGSNFEIDGLVTLDLFDKLDKGGHVVIGNGVHLSINFEDGSSGEFSLDKNFLIS